MRKAAFAIALLLAFSCSTPGEKAVRELAARIVPEYSGKIEFKEVSGEKDFYEISARKGGILIKGNNANSLAAGLGRYLDEAGIDVSWYASQAVE